MAAIPNGIDPVRDPATHAWLLDVFGDPDMPETFNWILQQLALNANIRVGTRARRDLAEKNGEVWPGLCWITLPDDPANTEWTAYPVYWTGTYFDSPDRRQRARYFPRSLFTNLPSIGFNPVDRRGVAGATWDNAPAGDYLIDIDFVMDTSKESSMTIGATANGKPIREDFRQVLFKQTSSYHITAVVSDHPGGNLIIDATAIVADKESSSTLYTSGTGVRMGYLGRFTK
jgi:hypothetical protein